MSERVLYLEATLPAPVSEVWKRWTTQEGLVSFFAPACNIELKPDGLFEIFFYPDNPPGLRGADGQRVMAVDPRKLLSFTWNFPPDIPEIRDQRTLVIVRFEEVAGATKLTLSQVGWGTGDTWDRGFNYFTRAWSEMIFPRLEYSLKHGPIDWKNPPQLQAACVED